MLARTPPCLPLIGIIWFADALSGRRMPEVLILISIYSFQASQSRQIYGCVINLNIESYVSS
jgi:hypothetical protein